MAERRMLSKKIIESDAFLDMPATARLLYYDLTIRADDDGFVNAPKKIARIIGASQDDLSVLIAKRFLLAFDSGVVVIKHWWMHNTRRKDRYKMTQYQDELNTLDIKENGAYTERFPSGCQVVAKRLPQTKLNEIKLNKNNVVVDKGEVRQWLSDRLTDEQWKKLENQYHDLSGLIDYVDNQVEDPKDIENPFKYIVQVAENRKWQRRRV